MTYDLVLRYAVGSNNVSIVYESVSFDEALGLIVRAKHDLGDHSFTFNLIQKKR